MSPRRSYKSDESFLRYLAIGAIGTRQVFSDLKKQGHDPIELERGSMDYKIWKEIKIKRVRVPDILCLNNGRRIESRAKTKFELSMSHSEADPKRSWDAGLRDDDFVAIALCRRTGDKPIDWRASDLVQYFSVEDMRAAHQQERTQEERPKGASEGFEIRLTWPTAVASSDGEVNEINEDRVMYRRTSDRRQLYRYKRSKSIEMTPRVSEGDHVQKGQVLLSVVPVRSQIPFEPSVSEQHYIQRLYSASETERYTAAKALSHIGDYEAVSPLADRVQDNDEHIYVRLEAAAGLVRLGDARGIAFVENTLQAPLEPRLEAVITLGEIGNESAIRLLTKTLQDRDQPPEIRAGAAWALGEIGDSVSIESLVSSFLDTEDAVQIEAARALAKLAKDYTSEIIDRFPSSNIDERPGIAWALSKAANFQVDELLPTLVDDNARRWIAYIIGIQDRSEYIEQIEALKDADPQVYFAVTVLWQILNSWVFELEEYG